MNLQNNSHFELNALISTLLGNAPVNTDKFDDAIEVMRRQHSLIVDEFEELRASIDQKKIVEVRDGIGDLVVVVDGMFFRLGIDYPRPTDWVFEKHSVEEALDMMAEELLKAGELTRFESYKDGKLDFYMRVHALYTNVLRGAYWLAQHYGIDLDADQRAIHESNMSKFAAGKFPKFIEA